MTAQDSGGSRGTESESKIHPLAQATYPGRILLMGVGVSLVAVVVWPQSMALGIGLLLFGLLYPHVVYLTAILSGRSKEVGYITFFLDTTVIAVLSLLMEYALVPSLMLLSIVTAVPLLMAGTRIALYALIPPIVILSVGLWFVEPNFLGHSDGWPLLFSGLAILSYVFYVSWQVNELGRRLIATRKTLETQNDRVSSQAAMLESMNRLAQLVNSTLDLERVMVAIGDSLPDSIKFDQQFALFIDRERNGLVLKRFVGANAERITRDLADFSIPLDESGSIFVTTALKQRFFAIEDASTAVDRMSFSDRILYRVSPVKSLISFPLSIQNEVIGILVFSDTSRHMSVGEEDIAIIGRHVELITAAVRNARLYEEVKQAQMAADAANQAKSQFLANMSHELRTPMNAVIGYSEMLMEEAEDQGLVDFISDLERICTASKHLLSLINDVLDLSKIEANKVELYPEPVDLEHWIDDLRATITPVAETNGNVLEIERRGEPDDIITDATKLRQAALNLLSNAAKFTSQGRIRLLVNQYRVGHEPWLEISVSDTGIGMSSAQVERVFQPFTQADASTTRKFGGTGLGLAISKRFCELMGGDIEATSVEGQGSTFTIRVPAQLGFQHSQAPGDQVLRATNQSGGLGTVLVIDDDLPTLDLMRRLLGKEGYTVITAESGQKGLDLARQHRPGLITLDALMPGMDGWSVLSKLKADPQLKSVPVIMVSFFDEPGKGLALGAAEYLTKPVDKQQLMLALSRQAAGTVKEALVVEDDQRTRELVSSWLQREGWSVRSATNGREGLEYFRSYRPAVVILDLMMPEVDGFEFLASLRSEFPEENPSVLVITARDLTPEDLARLNGGVARIINKSLVPGEQLIRAIARYVPAIKHGESREDASNTVG